MNLRVLFGPFSLFHEMAAEVVEHDIKLFVGMEPHELIHEIKEFDPAFATGLYSRHRGRQPTPGREKLEARIIDWTLHRKPSGGATQWSTRGLARELGTTQTHVSQVWRKAGLQPHRLRRYMASNDPDFEAKAADVIGLYLNPPVNAAVFSVDEKSAIQALDRLDPVLPLSPGRAERHGFEYYRHGTLSLYAALNVRTGQVVGKTSARHTSAEFVAFLVDVVATQPADKEIHIIVDNLSAHKTKRVARVSGRASKRHCPLHTDLLFLAQPGRNLVFEDPA